MSDQRTKPGTVNWFDLTVANAEPIRDFYKSVIGWETSPVDMGGYNDFCMHPEKDGVPIAGICNARGNNAGMPAQWIMYITVANLDESMKRVAELGGKVINGPRNMGKNRYCIIEDPAGAVCGLFE
jgi:predicted enzyme related to lactoylglutathione lyase